MECWSRKSLVHRKLLPHAKVSDVNDVVLKINKIALSLLISDMFQNILSFEQALDYSLGEEACQ